MYNILYVPKIKDPKLNKYLYETIKLFFFIEFLLFLNEK